MAPAGSGDRATGVIVEVGAAGASVAALSGRSVVVKGVAAGLQPVKLKIASKAIKNKNQVYRILQPLF